MASPSEAPEQIDILADEAGIDGSVEAALFGRIGGKLIDKVPAIGLKLVVNLIDEAPRSVERDRFLPSGHDSQQVIESDEVVDMRMRDKDTLKPLNFARR